MADAVISNCVINSSPSKSQIYKKLIECRNRVVALQPLQWREGRSGCAHWLLGRS